MAKNKFEDLVSFLKVQGFVFPGSEIYGGLANSWDMGPLGVALKRNLTNLWWSFFVSKNKYNVGIDSNIIMNNNVWKASGHLDNFSDPLVDCKNCKNRFRADKLIEDFDSSLNAGGWTDVELSNFLKTNSIKCPNCKKMEFTDIRHFELMFKTHQGVIHNDDNIVHLRPETAQGIFVNFKNVLRTSRKKIPFGIGQIGKSFRNEITPGNFIFRTREFEQMELEFFFDPKASTDWFDYWLNQVNSFLDLVEVDRNRLFIREHDKKELAHYASRTVDIEFDFSFGRGELWGIANRTNFDLNQHEMFSKQDLKFLDQESKEKYIPHVIEPSVGVQRLMLAILESAYCEEVLENETSRIVMKLAKKIAPYKIAVLPLSKQLFDQGEKLFDTLSDKFDCTYDASGNIGKRYRRQDAIGTPYCLTIDFETQNDGCVTIRDRDSMKQDRIKISELETFFNKNL